MRCAPNNVLTSEQPVPPAEASHVVEHPEKQDSRLRILDGVLLYANLLGLFANIREELAVRKRAVCAELV